MGGENPDWLPVGWRVSVKVRTSGKKDKYYINLSNGLRFNSKPEVLRYVKGPVKERNLNELSKVIVLFPNAVDPTFDIKKTAAEKLPPGWIKEIRTKKKGGKTRRDPYYIDPVSGRHFRSMQEVFRYIESKGTKKPKSKPDEECHADVDLADEKGPKLSSGSKGAAMNKNGNMPEDSHLEPREEHDSLATELSDKLQLGNKPKQYAGSKVAALKRVDMPVVEQRERNDADKEHNGGRRQSRRLSHSKLRDNVTKEQSLQPGTEDDAAENIITLENNGSEQREKENNSINPETVARQNKRKESTSELLPRRTSKRLARVEEVDPLLRPKPSNKSEAEVSTTESVDKSETEIPTNKKEKKPITRAKISSPEECKNLDPCLDDLLTDPCIEFAVKTLTGAIPIEDVKKVGESSVSSFASPCADIWADPCFEFAVKTLTGDIPLEDGSQFPDSLQQP